MGQKYYTRACAATFASCVIAIFATAYGEVYEYDGILPEVSGDEFTETSIPTWVTDPTRWTGTVSITNVAVKNFTVNTYGNESSVVRLSNVSGYLNAPGNYAFTNSVPVELVGTLTINDGFSVGYDDNMGDKGGRCALFKKLSGNGQISANGNAPNAAVVIQDASGFSGSIGLNNKIIVFGERLPVYDTAALPKGLIHVTEGSIVTNKGFWWAVGGIKVDGELCAASLGSTSNPDGNFGRETTITTSDTGIFTLTSTGNGVETENDTSYARIKGTGTLKYAGAGWRAISTNNFPTAMTVENEQAGDLLLSRALTYTIGSFAGSKNLQGNYGSGDRYLRVLQAKDTEWSGSIIYDYYDRFKGFIVAPGVSGAGTLTLSGDNTKKTTALTVESGAKVKLTGAWQGTTTVAGTLGGTGTITGDLTLSDGATLNIVDLDNPLKVSGNFSATGTIEVHLPSGADLSHLKTVLSATGTINAGSATFLVTSIGGEAQNPAHYSVKAGKNRLFVTGNHGHRVIFR